MELLNIFENLYSNTKFMKYFFIALIALSILFILVFIIGLIDAKKSKNPKKEHIEELKDITFEMPENIEPINEDVTLEMPTLTKNLEDFKKSIEAEINNESLKEEITTMPLPKPTIQEEVKQTKVLDINEIEGTIIDSEIPTKKEEESNAKTNKE